jgi:hypothetical protein
VGEQGEGDEGMEGPKGSVCIVKAHSRGSGGLPKRPTPA